MKKRDAQVINDDVVDAVAAIRNQKGISQYRLAKDTGISQSSISNIEKHKQHPTLYTLLMIAECIGVELGSIITKINSGK